MVSLLCVTREFDCDLEKDNLDYIIKQSNPYLHCCVCQQEMKRHHPALHQQNDGWRESRVV